MHTPGMDQAAVQRSVYDPLRQRMLEDMQVRNLSPHTQRAYIENVARFARHFGRSPVELGPEEIRSFQVYLTRERKLAPSSLGIAVCALRSLYKVTLKQPWSFDDLIPAPKKPRRLPVVLLTDDQNLAISAANASSRVPWPSRYGFHAASTGPFTDCMPRGQMPNLSAFGT